MSEATASKAPSMIEGTAGASIDPRRSILPDISGPAAKRELPASDARFGWVAAAMAGCVTLALLTMVGRVAQLQLRPTDALQEHMEPRVSTRVELPLRGDIQDRKGRLLSATRFGRRLVVDPTLLPQPVDETILKLAKAAGVKPEDLGGRVTAVLMENDRRAKRAADLGIDPKAVRAKQKHARETAAAETMPGGVSAPIGPVLGSVLGTGMGTGSGSGPGALGATDAVGRPLPGSSGAPGASSPVLATSPVHPPIEEESIQPIRYLVCSNVLRDDQVRAVEELKVPGVMLEKQPVREYPGGSEVASLVGKVGYGDTGIIGLEALMDKKLDGKEGAIRYVRDARGRPLWIEPGGVTPPLAGSDVKLSLDLEIQRIAVEELNRRIEETDAQGGRLMVLDPHSGEVLAMVDIVRKVPGVVAYPWVDAPPPKKPRRKGEPAPPPPPEPNVLKPGARYAVIKPDPMREIHPALARNRCIEDVYEPGSTFKPFVWATVTTAGLLKPEDTIDTEGGRWVTPYGRHIEDVTKRDVMSWREVLINSSNIGMVKGASKLSFQQLHDAVVKFGFGKPTKLGLPGEGAGIVTSMKDWSQYSQTSVAFGHEIAVTPLQIVRAFANFCREGENAGTLPSLTMVARGDEPDPRAVRVLPAPVAILTRHAMQGVVDNLDAKLAKHDEKGWKYSMFGKSGTAEIPLGGPPAGKKRPRGSSGYFDDQFFSSFLAGAPLEDPRLVVLCVLDDPRAKPGQDRRERYGSAAAGPCVRRVVERSLTYLGVTPSPESQMHDGPAVTVPSGARR
jgi:cell division protein FtsI/penicillin-binding protein 2